MRRSETGHTRRDLLGAGLSVTALAGCGLLDEKPPPPAVADPLQPLLDESLAMAAAYERAAVSQPGLAARLTPLAADHRAHAAELARVIGKPPPSSAAAPGESAPADAATLATLRTAEQRALRNAAAACRQAPATRAALVGSIAACRATHVEALR